MLHKPLILLIAVSGLVCGYEESRLQVEALFDDLENYLESGEYSDSDEDDAKEEMQKIIADHGFDADYVFSDIFNLLGGALGLLHSGDGRRYASMNFAYQLACYQGQTGGIFSKIKWALGKYNSYGCYCGGGFYNQNYVDATDLCCKIHDKCYEDAMKKYKLGLGCHTYTTTYSVSCCVEQKYTKCTDNGPSAGRALCECDQAMSKCVAKRNALSTYNEAYLKKRSKCRDNSHTKSMSLRNIIKSCQNDAFKSRVKLPREYGSQGRCPRRRKRGWFWGK